MAARRPRLTAHGRRWGVATTGTRSTGSGMTGGPVGGDFMPRSALTTVLVALALAASTLGVTTTAAQAAWSRPGELVKYRVCRADGPGNTWVLTSRVRKYYRTPDARASLAAYAADERVARWRTGWLDRGEVQISRVRVRRSPEVRVVVTQEAGDRESDIGTTAESLVLKPRRIQRCG